ncbi:MAG: MotA/TolQ/ExbB proton channel family protein [Gammaproteobacteria bacterium]|uniref:MotA/TolQ/ExbB proton channel family protein n=1 Tax=Nevskia sp. TaxID=1929292 RepID=UPI003F71D847|nr:MotA/TolQ/ExbB proton channel family protein [Gammaproteobacteria bacterium]
MNELLHIAFELPRDSWEDFLRLGGWVVQVILVAALAMWTLILERYWYLKRIHPQRLAEKKAEWSSRGDRRSWTAQRIREQLLSELKVGMSATMPLIKVMVPLAPLLGLLGTVAGMLEVFDAMTAAGQADVRAMAYGVSHAMVATLAGLVVSLLGLFFSVRLAARVRWESDRLPDRFVTE